jgi:hypothetical protein
MDMFNRTHVSLDKQEQFNANRTAYRNWLAKNNIAICYRCGVRNLFDWTDKDIFKKRLNLYKKNIKLLKNE